MPRNIGTQVIYLCLKALAVLPVTGIHNGQPHIDSDTVDPQRFFHLGGHRGRQLAGLRRSNFASPAYSCHLYRLLFVQCIPILHVLFDIKNRCPVFILMLKDNFNTISFMDINAFNNLHQTFALHHIHITE